MKTKLLILSIMTLTTLTLISICFFACGDDDDYSFLIYEDKELKEHFNFNSNGYSNYWVEVVEGDMLVFEYRFFKTYSNSEDGSGYSETVRFEIDKEASSFYFENEEIIPTKCHIMRYSGQPFCYKVSEGFIEGTKLNENEWQVKFDVYVIDESGTEFRVTVDHVFMTEV